MNVLNTTKFVHVNGGSIFFLEENNGIFGKLDIKSGEVWFYDNTPDELLGKESFDAIMIADNDDIYIIYKKGKRISRFNCSSGLFEEIICDGLNDNNHIDSWAGVVDYENHIYLFARKDGCYLKFDLKNKTLDFRNTGIKEKIMWICNDGERVFLLSWDCNSLYIYDLSCNHMERKTINLNAISDISGKSVMPVHALNYAQNCIYFLDKKYLFKMQLDKLEIELLYDNLEMDNGTRMRKLDQRMIIPPYDGYKFTIIDIKSGSTYKVVKIPDGIHYGLRGNVSRVGVPCENKDFFFYPLISADKYAVVSKHSLDFSFKNLIFNEINIASIANKIVRKNEMIRENLTIELKSFIRGLFTL